MFTKNEFIEKLNRSLKVAQRHMKIEDKDRPNLHIANVETIDFDLEATMKEWATENNVNCAVVDISTLTLDDVSAIPEILSTPTALLLKNFGDYTHDMLREPYRQLVKDCCYGTDGIFANNFLFAVATTKSDMPIRDMSERCCFGHFNN
jgi:hypothetical protein